MKTALTLSFGILSLFAIQSCSSDPKTPQAVESAQKGVDSVETKPWFPETNFDTLRGIYTGDFGDGFIHVILTYVNDKKAVGYNIHKGLQRNISGDVAQHKDYFELTMNEPGDNPYDGVFVLKINKRDFSADATWTAKDPKIGSKSFHLKKKISAEKPTEKFYYDGYPITEANFQETFSRSQLEGGNLFFDEDGLVTFSYYPDGQKTEQLETIKGSWKINPGMSLLIAWAKNSYFKERNMKFKLIQKKESAPLFKASNGMEITFIVF